MRSSALSLGTFLLSHSENFGVFPRFSFRETVAIREDATAIPGRAVLRPQETLVALPSLIAYIPAMVWRVRGRPLNSPASFVHPYQPTVASKSSARHCFAQSYVGRATAFNTLDTRRETERGCSRRFANSARKDPEETQLALQIGTIEKLDQGQESERTRSNTRR